MVKGTQVEKPATKALPTMLVCLILRQRSEDPDDAFSLARAILSIGIHDIEDGSKGMAARKLSSALKRKMSDRRCSSTELISYRAGAGQHSSGFF